MKTVIVPAPGKIEIREVETPAINAYQALVKTEMVALCNATDSKLIAGHFPGVDAYPLALGHENAGIVVAAGEKVRNFKVISCTWREVLGAFKDFNLTPGKKVIVVGSGPVGLSFVKLGKLFGLGQIDIVDMLPAKLEVARRMGADNGYTPAEISTPEFIAAANRSYDAVIDAVGLDVVVNSVLPLVKMGGDVCVYGVMTKNPTFDLSKAPYNFDLHMHQWPTRSEEKAAMTTLAQWIEEGRLSASDFITHRFKIEEIEEAFAAVKRGEVLKCVLTF